MVFLNSLTEPPTGLDILLAVGAILTWVAAAYRSRKSIADERFKAILKRLDAIDASIEHTRR
jgi:hypothetical protein